MADLNGVAAGQRHPPFDDVFQFPDIARKIVAQQDIHHLRLDIAHLLVHQHPVFSDKMLDQQRQVILALGQGRDMERHHIDPEKQILPEVPQLYLLLEVPVGCRKKADIDLDR